MSLSSVDPDRGAGDLSGIVARSGSHPRACSVTQRRKASSPFPDFLRAPFFLGHGSHPASCHLALDLLDEVSRLLDAQAECGAFAQEIGTCRNESIPTDTEGVLVASLKFTLSNSINLLCYESFDQAGRRRLLLTMAGLTCPVSPSRSFL